MDRNWPDIVKINQRNFFASLVLVFVLIGSCPIKMSIKNLIGIPVKTEQNAPKNMHAHHGTGIEKCADGEIKKVKVFQTNSSTRSGLLPIIFFALTFIYVRGFPLTKGQLHPSYGNLKIPAALPFFLQYRRLII